MKLKRLLAPEFWKVAKKEKKWVVSPAPGPHKKFECIPLLIIAREILKIVETGREAKKIIKNGEIFVDGKARKDHAYPVGLMDTISIPKLNQSFRVVPSTKGLELIKISEKEAKLKLCKIVNKTTVKKGRLQLNLHDGRNILVEKDVFNTGDSLLLSLPEQKILEHVKLGSKSLALITKGKNAGKIAEVEKVEGNKVVCRIENNRIEVIKDYVLALGKEKPLIEISHV